MKTLEEIIIQILEDPIGYNIVNLLEKQFLNIIGGNFSVKLLKDILIYNFYKTILEDKLCKTIVGHLFLYNLYTIGGHYWRIYCTQLLEAVVYHSWKKLLKENIEGDCFRNYWRKLFEETIGGNRRIHGYKKLFKKTIGGNSRIYGWKKLLKKSIGGNRLILCF